MSAIHRNITRAILNSTEITGDVAIPGSDSAALVLTTSDSLYIGHFKRFASRHFQMGTANTNAATLSASYWDGDSWSAVEDLIDQTEGMTKSGFISWVNPSSNAWQTQKLSPVSSRELYWLRIQTSANFSAGTTLQSVLNLFCDNVLMRDYYPELVTDTRYLPSGRTDFTEQFNAAKNMVVDQLKANDLIRDESEILDINEVAIAAVHASAWIIYNPILRDTDGREFLDGIWNAYQKALKGRKIDLDYDNSGVIEPDELNTGNFFKARV